MSASYLGRDDFDHGERLRVGVLLANLGTPDAPRTPAVRRFLREFLTDPRVIEYPRWLWRPLLEAVVLRTRPRRSAEAYASVWSERGSPLRIHAEAQTAAVQAAFDAAAPDCVRVALAMRYGKPDVGEALDALLDAGVSHLVVLPLYPQYSATTTGSVFDALGAELSRRRWIPNLAFVSTYHDDAGYVAALDASVREHWAAHGEPDRLLLSFHGIPRRYFLAGDPYFCFCHKTARLLAESLGLDDSRWAVSFQSRVGREQWLRPYTDETLQSWGAEGVAHVQVACPGFSADCLETLEEIAIENRERFLEAGGERFEYVPALNARADHVAALVEIVRRRAGRWIEAMAADDRVAGERAERALSLGAER